MYEIQNEWKHPTKWICRVLEETTSTGEPVYQSLTENPENHNFDMIQHETMVWQQNIGTLYYMQYILYCSAFELPPCRTNPHWGIACNIHIHSTIQPWVSEAWNIKSLLKEELLVEKANGHDNLHSRTFRLFQTVYVFATIYEVVLSWTNKNWFTVSIMQNDLRDPYMNCK